MSDSKRDSSSPSADLHRDVLLAAGRISAHLRRTWLEPSPHFGGPTGTRVGFKLENLQHTGSFKVRGAMNALLSLSTAERARGAVAASTGNHAAAVAWCLDRLDVPGVVFMPESASPTKVSAVERFGVEIRRVPGDPIEAELRARRYADEWGATYVSPYNDARVIAGQGTVAVELEQQADPIDAVFVSLGGGGLISGIAGYLKRVRPGVRVIGCSPENSAVMIRSQEVGRLVELPCLPTLSDGTAGGIERDSITFELCRTLVDEYVTVTEDEIRQALRAFVEVHHMLIEGAAAVALASFLKLRQRFRGQSVVVVICGGNIDLETLGTIL